MDLPKLENGEVDEAIRWQADDYIPINPKEMILDWKTLGETQEAVHVLTVAVNEKLLQSYIVSADSAGLFPMVVETPSISLVRAAGMDKITKLIVYFSYDEIIITLSKGDEILTSSVLGVNSAPQTVVTTIKRIIRHFDDQTVDKIYMGGMPVNNSYVPEITKNFQIPAEKLQHHIQGLGDADLQRYLIPLSLQFKDPSEPSSEKTINLIPPEIISKYKSKRFSVQIWGIMLIVTLILVGCTVALSGTYFYLVEGLSKYNGVNTLSDVSYQKSKTASDQIKLANTLSDRTVKIDSVSVSPQQVLNLIYKQKPESVAILDYKLDLEKGSITIEGLSAGRNDLYDFKTNIEGSGDFQQVELPLSSFEQGSNIQFKMSFVYTKLSPAK